MDFTPAHAVRSRFPALTMFLGMLLLSAQLQAAPGSILFYDDFNGNLNAFTEGIS